jgi:hypothetical protein
MRDIYFLDDEENRHGPYSAEELRDLSLHDGTLVWREGMRTWQTLGGVPELRSLVLSSEAPAEPIRLPTTRRTAQPPRLDATARRTGGVPNADVRGWGAGPVEVGVAPTSGAAGIVALVLAVLGLCAWCTPVWVFASFAFSLAATIVAVAALVQFRRAAAGRGPAVAGLVIGSLNLLLSGVMLLIIGLFVTADARRNAASATPRPTPVVPATIPVMPNFEINQPRFPTSFPGVRTRPPTPQATQPSD